MSEFTPRLLFAGVPTGITYQVQAGYYELVGNRVHWSAELFLTSKGANSGVANIDGLPFVVIADPLYVPPLKIQGSGLVVTDLLTAIHGQNSDRVILQQVSDGGALTAVTDANFTDTTRLRMSGSYFRKV